MAASLIQQQRKWHELLGEWDKQPLFRFPLRIVEAAFVAGEDEVTLTSASTCSSGGGGGSGSHQAKSFNLNLKSMHEIREENGTARPIQRKLTSQLQVGL